MFQNDTNLKKVCYNVIQGDEIMWCKTCNREVSNKKCEICGSETQEDIPVQIQWCSHCNVPIIKALNEPDIDRCPLCNENTNYLTTDIRPAFPAERLLFEILKGKPMEYKDCSVWVNNNKYYVNGKTFSLSSKELKEANPDEVREKLAYYKEKNEKECSFQKYIDLFIQANKERLNYIKSEAFAFIQKEASKYDEEQLVISFSGGKDSTVVADLTVRALSNPSIVHIYGDTTLEFPLSYEYVQRFKKNNPMCIFKTAKNRDQEFYDVAEKIGPPARMLRWCCTMFKTGPITRTINGLFREKSILTFYGIRKNESVSRSKYNRVEDKAGSVKILKQKVASPIFYWCDGDIWLYMLAESVDFNDAYKLGYDRVGCWCCPNNNERSQFLAKIYMPEQFKKWRQFLIDFAKSVGKPDPEVYVDEGKWKARQGGNGVKAAENIKIKYTNCTAEDHAKIYQLNRPIEDYFYNMFTPFGIVSRELGKKLINEVIVLDMRTNVPIISIQPFNQDGYQYAVKIKTMNVEKHDDLQRMIGYQVRKYNACMKCLKCESICRFGAITITPDEYRIDENKCKRCKACVTPKILVGGCLMTNYLSVKDDD